MSEPVLESEEHSAAQAEAAKRAQRSWVRLPFGILSGLMTLFFGYGLLTFAIPRSYRAFTDGQVLRHELGLVY